MHLVSNICDDASAGSIQAAPIGNSTVPEVPSRQPEYVSEVSIGVGSATTEDSDNLTFGISKDLQKVVHSMVGDGLVRRNSLDTRRKKIVSAFAVTDRVRACSVWEVLAGWGRVLADNTVLSQKAHDEKSMPVELLDGFLSHSWWQPRHRKFLQLALVYNWPAAMILSVAGALVGMSLHFAHVLPVLNFEAGHQGFASALLGALMFIVGFLCWAEVMQLRCGRFARPMVFLDKYCINQADLNEKKEGIKALESTIVHSRQLVVLHSPTYFSRLWTVYEVACFMSVHRISRFRLIPEFLPMFVLGFNTISSILFFVYKGLSYQPFIQLIGAASWASAFSTAVSTATVFAGTLAGIVIMRRWAREVESIAHSLRSFKIQEARCYDESDRPIVEEHIALLERSLQRVPTEASVDVALASFNHKVRNQLADAVKHSLGRQGIIYRYVVTMFWVGVLRSIDVLSGSILANESGRRACMRASFGVVDTFVFYPLAMVGVSMVGRSCLHFCNELVKEVTFVLSTAVAMTVLVSALIVARARFLETAIQSDVVLAAYVACHLPLCVATWWAYSLKGFHLDAD